MYLLRLMLLLLVFLVGNTVKATHIVGGEISYRHLVNDSFELTLVLYVDCINGSPAAVSQDSIAVLGIFNATNTLVQSVTLKRSLPVRINSVNYNCIQPPTNACVDQYTYITTVNLPQVSGGYVIAFQRCCRNGSINNIVTPLSTGATYWTTIPDTVQTSGYNSAAVFNSLPPNFLCNKREFVFNHSASDADGDSLAYVLYTPYLGASTFQSAPRPPAAPPYAPVAWLPPYDEAHMMLGSPELAINPLTGEIRVNPQSTGQFVVGIAVQEFRNGTLISTTRRDFQFNVLNCIFDVVSALSNNLTACSDTVQFENQSQGADAYLWSFGDPTTFADTSSEKNPVYIYPAPGIYRVKLVVSKGNCSDSSEVTINLLSDTIRFAGNDTTVCPGAPVVLGITDTGHYVYTWTPVVFLDDPTRARPTSVPMHSVAYIAKRTNDWCENTDTITITVLEPKADFSLASEQGCMDATIYIDSVGTFSRIAWHLNDRPVSFEELTGARYRFDTRYVITMTADTLGCTDSLQKEITIPAPSPPGFIPNVFTPNNDGYNDCYAIDSVIFSGECSQIIIYNRWGLVLFDSDKDGICWDGTWKGVAAKEGTYFYLLKHRGKEYHGTITLLR